MAAKRRPVPGRDRRKEARTGIAATSRSVQEFPVVRRERSALTSHACNAIMIGKKELQRCRRTRPRSDRQGFRKVIRNTHVHTPCLTNYYLAVCLVSRHAPPSERLPISLRANGNLLNNFRLIWVIQPPAQKYFAFPHPQISGYFRAVPSRQEGRIASRHERGTGCGGRRQRQAREVVRRAGFPVSGHGAQDERRCSVRQNRVVPTPVAGAKLPVANSIQPDRFSHQAGSDGGKTNSSPGRARHKPSNHCAGNAGVLRLYLYARVRFSLHYLHTRPRVQQAPGIPCSLSFGGTRNCSKPRAHRAARTRHTFSCHHPRNAHDGVIQYSRDAVIHEPTKPTLRSWMLPTLSAAGMTVGLR